MLLALVDAHYKFLYVHIGNYGRSSDGGFFNNSTLGSALASNKLDIPPPQNIANTDIVTPFFIVPNDAFAMKPYLIKPYGFRKCTANQRVFNYRLSRARRVVETGKCFWNTQPTISTV